MDPPNRPHLKDLTAIKVTFNSANSREKTIFRNASPTSNLNHNETEARNNINFFNLRPEIIEDNVSGEMNSIGMVNQQNTNQSEDEQIVTSESTWQVCPMEEDEINYLKKPGTPPPFKIPSFLRRKTQRINQIDPKDNRLGIEIIFPDICYPFLSDSCIANEFCLDSHEYPLIDILQRLNTIGTENVSKIFHNIVRRCPKLLECYFQTFLDYFVLQGQQDDIIKSIDICNRSSPEQWQSNQQYLGMIIKAMGQSGFSYGQTIRWALLNLKNPSEQIVGFLLNANLSNLVDLNDLNGILVNLKKQHHRFNLPLVERLMVISIHLESDMLIRTTFGILSQFLSNQNPNEPKINNVVYQKFSDAVTNLKNKRSY